MNNDAGGEDRLTRLIIGCGFAVANGLGCGFLEKVYENFGTPRLQVRRLSSPPS